jgi:hypothetical protein
MMWGLHFGINWAGVFYGSWLLLWLSILATALYVGTMAALNFAVMLRLPFAWNSSPRISKAFGNALRLRRLVSKWAPSAILFVVGYVLGQASVFSPIRELHGVEVTGKLDDRVYSVIVPAQWNPPMTKDRSETLRLCAEGDDLPLTKGMIIDPLQYIQEKDCILINKDTLVDWKRDKDNNVVDRSGRILFTKKDED